MIAAICVAVAGVVVVVVVVVTLLLAARDGYGPLPTDWNRVTEDER